LIKNIFLVLLLTVSSLPSFAAGPSNEWTQGWQPSTPQERAAQFTQADLIAKREAGYYKNIGSTNITYYSTTAAGTLNTTNITITGNNNSPSVSSTGTNSGSQNGSINTGSQLFGDGVINNGVYSSTP
jgi:hypothetical protein